jgi:hypothetical protein
MATMVNSDLMQGAFVVVWIAGFLFGLMKACREIVRGRRRTSRTTGTIVRVVSRGTNVIVPSPDIEFIDGDGIKHLCESTFGTSWNQWPVGSRVAVTYDQQDPTNCELALSHLGVAAIAIWVAGAIFVAVGTILTIRISYLLIQAVLSL